MRGTHPGGGIQNFLCWTVVWCLVPIVCASQGMGGFCCYNAHTFQTVRSFSFSSFGNGSTSDPTPSPRLYLSNTAGVVAGEDPDSFPLRLCDLDTNQKGNACVVFSFNTLFRASVVCAKSSCARIPNKFPVLYIST
jgi:hypothetical protein